ncbi:ergosterol biosynthetic protein 28 [Nannochloropsis oceanica]
MKNLLRVWLICVASLRVLSVVLGYLQPATLAKSVFGLATDQVTPLTARTFGIWTLLSAIITLMCALNIESGPLYRTTMASFAVALLYFVLEVGVYHTVDVRSAMPPFIIATLSVLLLAAGYSYIVVEDGGSTKRR